MVPPVSQGLLLLVGLGTAQHDSLAQPLRSWSVHGGANYTWYADPLGTGHGPYAGHGVGGVGYSLGFTHERTQGRFGILTGSQLEQRSAGYDFNEGQGNVPPGLLADGLDRGHRSMRTVQLQVPVLVVYRGFPGLRLEAGPTVGRMLRATELRRGTRASNGREEALYEQGDRTGALATWEFTAMVGALVEGPRGIHAHLRYVSGFTNMDLAAGSSASFTKQVQITLVYAFGQRGDRTPSVVGLP